VKEEVAKDWHTENVSQRFIKCEKEGDTALHIAYQHRHRFCDLEPLRARGYCWVSEFLKAGIEHPERQWEIFNKHFADVNAGTRKATFYYFPSL
jgi:hypothetical protein